MKILHVIQDMSNRSAGPSYTVARLAQGLKDSGDSVSIKTLNYRANDADGGLIDSYSGPLERFLGFSPSLMRDIARHASQEVILHGHLIWRPLYLFPLMLRRELPSRVVWSPRGTLAEWCMSYKRRLKQPFWHSLQKPSLARANCMHATSYEEYQEIRSVGLTVPVAIVPNGVDQPSSGDSARRSKTVLYVGRIDPKKGIDLLLRSWAKLEHEFAEWKLIIAGPMNGGYADGLRRLARELGVQRTHFIGEVYGSEKSTLYSSASIFVLPSHNENFGMVVAEALMHRTPVITTTATPWKDLTTNRCGWCVPVDEIALQSALRNAIQQPVEVLRRMGEAGRSWMQSDYSWPSVACQMREVYRWLQQGGEPPQCVMLS